MNERPYARAIPKMVGGGKLPETEAPQFKAPEPEPPKPQHPAMRWLTWIGVVVSAFACVVTTVNSFEWWAALRPVWVAVPMAVVMVGASVFLPDFGILVFMQKKRFLGGAIFASGVVATLFCMVTTVAALYNTHSIDLAAAMEDNRAATLAGESLRDNQSERQRLLGEIDRYNALIDSTQAKIEGLTAAETLGGVAQTLQTRLLSYQTQRQSYERDLTRVNAGIAALRDRGGGSQEGRPGFYAFVGGVFGVSPVTIEFLTATIPAVFLEIVAPVMVAVVMFI